LASAGLLSADKNLTVSPNYALEVCSGSDKGVELNDILSKVGIEGIVNGALHCQSSVCSTKQQLQVLLWCWLWPDVCLFCQTCACSAKQLQVLLWCRLWPDLCLFCQTCVCSAKQLQVLL
jgi:hypothetical protein